jgi:hypothetical protein
MDTFTIVFVASYPPIKKPAFEKAGFKTSATSATPLTRFPKRVRWLCAGRSTFTPSMAVTYLGAVKIQLQYGVEARVC